MNRYFYNWYCETYITLFIDYISSVLFLLWEPLDIWYYLLVILLDIIYLFIYGTLLFYDLRNTRIIGYWHRLYIYLYTLGYSTYATLELFDTTLLTSGYIYMYTLLYYTILWWQTQTDNLCNGIRVYIYMYTVLYYTILWWETEREW